MKNNEVLPGFDEDTCNFLTIDLQKVETMDDCLVLKLTGQIDTYSSHFFQKSAKKTIDAGFINLILLLGGVDYLASKAVGALIQIQKAAREKGGDITIVDVHPKVMEVFNNLNLEKFFACTDSLDAAIAFMKSEEKVLTPFHAIECPLCERKLRIVKSGQFRCPECKSVLSIDELGTVHLGSV